MYRREDYLANPAEVDAFVASQRHGYLIASPPGGFPSVTIVPFLRDGDTIEVHLAQGDPTFLAIEANPNVTFLVSDYLAHSPHYWIDPRNASRATLHFRAVQFRCEAKWSKDPADVAAMLARLVETYDGPGEYAPLSDSAVYGALLSRLAVVRLRVVETEAKFKVGPAGPAELKLRVAESLRGRGMPGDTRAAEIIEQRVREQSQDGAPAG